MDNFDDDRYGGGTGYKDGDIGEAVDAFLHGTDEPTDGIMDMQGTAIDAAVVGQPKLGKCEHEIYEGTYYIPNDKLRLLEIPMNSSLPFQMLLYYHAYYDFLYGLILIPSGLFKIIVGGRDAFIIVNFILTVFFCLTEYFRLNFGYAGNINESFPDLCVFLMQTFLFSFAFVFVPLFSRFKFPHEDAMYAINVTFMAFELILGFFVMYNFSSIQQAAFYRRTAPLIDKKFKKKYMNSEAFKSSGSNDRRGLELGMIRHNKNADTNKIFADSDHDLLIEKKEKKHDSSI